MTDKEIIKALECCTDYPSCPTDCPLYEQPVDCLLKLSKPTLNLINRQKAEIESLKLNVEALAICKKDLPQKTTNAIKAEAIKEFAERLKEEMGWWEEPDGYYTRFISPDDFDNLVKEMVGEASG